MAFGKACQPYSLGLQQPCGDIRVDTQCTAQALKSVPDDERERAERKVKLRTLGNIRLIAELYKQDVVPEKILHACIQEMLGDGKSEPIEDNVEASPARPDCSHGTTLS